MYGGSVMYIRKKSSKNINKITVENNREFLKSLKTKEISK